MSSGFVYEDLISIAENNAVKGEKKIKTSTAPQFNLLGKPKPKATPKDKKLSEGVQKFLKKREEEERKKQVEKRVQKEQLLQLRAQDKKAHKRVSSMLRMTKSANKACIADARDSFSDALAEQGEMQPDEDDYGYTSQYSQDMYKKLLDKYKLVPTNKPAPSKLPAPLPVPHNIAKTRHKEAVNYDYEAEVSNEKIPEFKEPEITNSKKKKKPPPPINFQDLLALANQKNQEPVGIKLKTKPTKPQEKEVFEFGRPMTAKEKQQFLQEKSYKEKIQNGLLNSSAGAKPSTPPNKSSDSSQAAVGKVGFKIPSVKKKETPPVSTPPIVSSSKSKDSDINDRKLPSNSSRGVSQNIPPSAPPKTSLPNRSPASSNKTHSQPSASANRPPIKNNSVPPKITKNGNVEMKGKSEYVTEVKPKPIAKTEPSRKLPQEKPRMPETMQSSKSVPAKSKPMSSMSENSSHPRQIDRQRPRSPPTRLPQQKRERSPPRQQMARPRSPPHRLPQRPPKRRQVIESDDEYDSEMDDFIDDGDADINVSELIRSITGYDRRKYVGIDEGDIREASFADQMREEARSKRLGQLEDLEDMKQEAEEKRLKALRMKQQKKKMKR